MIFIKTRITSIKIFLIFYNSIKKYTKRLFNIFRSTYYNGSKDSVYIFSNDTMYDFSTNKNYFRHDKANSTQRVEENRSTGKSDLAFASKLFIYTWKDRRTSGWKRLIRIDDRESRRKMQSSTMLNSTLQRNRSVWIFLKVETSPEASNVSDAASRQQHQRQKAVQQMHS